MKFQKEKKVEVKIIENKTPHIDFSINLLANQEKKTTDLYLPPLIEELKPIIRQGDTFLNIDNYFGDYVLKYHH